MDLESLTRTSGEGLQGDGAGIGHWRMSESNPAGPQSGSVPFPSRADDSDTAEIEEVLRTQIDETTRRPQVTELYLGQHLGSLDRQMLVERQLMSRSIRRLMAAEGSALVTKKTSA